MKVPDYYAVLGVERGATQDEIRKAYRRLARKFHPDVSKEPDAGRRMAEVNEAYEVLSDPKKREVYDQVGHEAWAQGVRSAEDLRRARAAAADAHGFAQGRGAGWTGHDWGSVFGHDHSEFFDELFGRMARARSRHASRGTGGPQAWPGEDQHARIVLALDEAWHGTQKTLQLDALEATPEGDVVPRRRTLQVKISAGVADGQLIRLAGQGMPGIGGGPAGDLFLQVEIRAPAGVRVEGRDVTMKVYVAPWEAALGGDIVVRTPGGPITVVVPAGSGPGRKLRVRGKGIPGRHPGDLYLELDVAVPGAVTPEQKAAWQALARAYPGFDPRGLH
jgi:curved DNA-binding protein